MQLKLVIKNKAEAKVRLELFKVYESCVKLNNGLPEGVSVEVMCKKEKDEQVSVMSYTRLLGGIVHTPIAVRVLSSTNNRALSFFSTDAMGFVCRIVPQLTIEGHRRVKDRMYWTMEDCWWNVADTKERFVLDWTTFIPVALEPSQTFEIVFDVSETIKIRDVATDLSVANDGVEMMVHLAKIEEEKNNNL